MELKAGDLLFIDTNILLSASDVSRQNHTMAKEIFKTAMKKGIHLCFSGQIIREYIAVATRDVSGNGLGMSPVEASANIDVFMGRMLLLEETEDTAQELLRLVKEHQLRGMRVHDANVAATMKSHAVTKLVTENVRDFLTFSGISAADPSGV